jgi:hypothetical protein
MAAKTKAKLKLQRGRRIFSIAAWSGVKGATIRESEKI